MKEINEQEKWSVKLTKDNIKIINEFFHKNSSYYKDYKPHWGFDSSDIESDYYFHFPETKSGCYASLDGYNIISNEEFLLKVNNDKTYPTSLNNVKFKSDDLVYDYSRCYPLTPKDCYTTLPDMIYVKKLKTFLK